VTLHVGEVRVHPAPEHERQRGLLAWASAEVSGIVLDGFTVRVDQAGNVYVGFPKRQDAEGRLHPWFWPIDPRDRQDLEAQILAAIGLAGLDR
jgi:hypothetical protein